MRHNRVILSLVACLLMGAFAGGVAHAQDTAAPDQIELKIRQIGVGGQIRPGDWCGIQVEFTALGAEAREIVLRLSLPDPERDSTELTRAVTATPGRQQLTWIYFWAPMSTDGGVLTITAHNAVEGVDPATGEPALLPGTRIATHTFRINESNVRNPRHAAMAIVGPRDARLGAYRDQFQVGQQVGATGPPEGHEHMDVVAGLTPRDLPDRWLGLAGFDTLVWTASGRDGLPRDLSAQRQSAEAVREWVARGGHFVVVMPPVAEPWLSDRSHPLAGIMPTAQAEWQENAELVTLTPLLTIDGFPRGDPNPGNYYTFALPADAPLGDARVILEDPQGRPVVVRRQFGIGAVTLVGVNPDLATFGVAGGVDAQAFWHRILGERVRLLTIRQAQARQNSNINPIRYSPRTEREFDGDISSQISLSGRAAAGLMLALVVFAVYWAIAGPGLFYALKLRSLTHHSWIAFVAAGGLFTAIAWTGAAALKPANVSARHITIIDHVYGQPVQRARSWMTVFMPQYGDAALSLENETANAAELPTHNAVAAWSSARTASWSAFPDARGYLVDSVSPDQFAIPSRSTTRQLRLDWAGPPADEWGMPRPVLPEGVDDPAGAIRLDRVNSRLTRVGVITHNLPQPLEDVHVFIIQNQRPIPEPQAQRGPVLAEGMVFSLADEWAPGAPLDLSTFTSGSPLTMYLENLRDAAGKASRYSFNPNDDSAMGNLAGRLNGISFMRVLAPPELTRMSGGGAVRALRRHTHGLDLSRWVTEPCVIILGHMPESESPVPLRVQGATIEARGHTMVRWVFPLAPNPPEYSGL